eukprot:6583248-Prymnesium_polylepis.1
MRRRRRFHVMRRAVKRVARVTCPTRIPTFLPCLGAVSLRGPLASEAGPQPRGGRFHRSRAPREPSYSTFRTLSRATRRASASGPRRCTSHPTPRQCTWTRTTRRPNMRAPSSSRPRLPTAQSAGGRRSNALQRQSTWRAG